MKIRPATEDDILDILIIGRQFARECKYPFDKDKTAQSISQVINSPDGTAIVWENDDGDIVGAILALIVEPFLSKRRQAHEMAWFVEKESRGKGGAIKLLKSLVDWADAAGADDLIMGDIHSLQDLSPLYERLGFRISEKLYTKEL